MTNRVLAMIKNYKSNGFENELTEEMDKHRKSRYANDISCTYLYDHQINKGSWPIRLPGATRGSLLVDRNYVITDILVYDDAYLGRLSCYEPSVVDAVKKFIGYRLSFKSSQYRYLI